MWRDIDPRTEERDRPDISRGSRGAADERSPAPPEPRDVFTRDLDLPKTDTRRPVSDRSRMYELRASEARILATVGTFRVVPARDLTGSRRALDPWNGDLRRLREAGLVRAVPHMVGRERTTLVTLTEAGRDLLEHNRSDSGEREPQRFYAGIAKPRELVHDAHLYRAYARAAERIHRDGGDIQRVVLDYELKSQYQCFLRDLNRDRRREERDSETREDAIAEWARSHHLPMDETHVQFPDVRIEYQRSDGRREVEDLEVVTPHYRGALAAAKARSGFVRFRISTNVGGRGGGGRVPDPRWAEEFL